MTPTARSPRIFTLIAVGAAIVVFAGFARSWYLKAWFGTPELPSLVHVHGAVMTLWFVLYVLQATLIATHRVALHRRIGLLGVALAVLVLLIGTHTAIEAARLDRMPGPTLAFLAVPLGDMVVFALFFGLGLGYRHRPDIHRRMMTLASIGMLGAALFRLNIPGGLPGTIGVIVAILAACVAADWLVNRRPHRAFAIGALLIALSWPLRLWLAETQPWQRLAGWLIA